MKTSPAGAMPENENLPASASTCAALPELDARDDDLDHITSAAWRAVVQANMPPFLFKHAGKPARIETEAGSSKIVHLDADRLRYHVARSAAWFRLVARHGEMAKVSAKPPMDVIRNMLAAPSLPLPLLGRIISAPVYGRDGTLHDEEGYSANTMAYYAPRDGFRVSPVPRVPTPQDVEKARRLLLDEMLGDFPFSGPAETAHAVAFTLLPFVRDLIDGPTPIHLIEAPEAGTGKSLLASVCMFPAVGQPVGAMTEARTEEEWRKRITSSLMAAPVYVFIDNVREGLDSSALSAATSAMTWTDRLLGGSANADLPIRCGWVVTGNNPALTKEVARRTVRIRLDARRDRPWERTGFRHPDILRWMTARRGEIVAALLTLVQAWIVKGRPAGKQSLGSYEDWAHTVGGILQVAGMPGFLENRHELYETSDAEDATHAPFIGKWWDQFGGEPVAVADLYSVAEHYYDLGTGTDRTLRTRLGTRLHSLRGRQFGDYRVETAGKVSSGPSKGSQRYRLIDMRGDGNLGNGGKDAVPAPDQSPHPTCREGRGNVPLPSPHSPERDHHEQSPIIWEELQ